MRRDIKNIVLIFLFIGFNSIVLASEFEWTQERLSVAYSKLSISQRKDLHINLLNSLDQQARKTDYEQEKINVYLTVNKLYFLESILDSAYASIDDPTIYCHFGGWMTTIKNSKCQAPWSRSVRNNAELEIFGKKYRNSCGGANLFRCNPLIFGPGDDGKGICTTTDDSDPRLSTSSCIDDFLAQPNSLEAHVESLIDNPEKLSQYLATTLETLRSCEVQDTPFAYCDRLVQILETTSEVVVQCSNQDNLLSYLPNIITPFNQDELDRITNGLGEKAVQYAKELEEKQEAIRLQNRKVLEEAISNATQEPRMRDTITRIRNNASKCLRELCNRSGFSNSKPANRSIAKCAAYVKHAIYPYPGEEGERYANFSEYPWSRNADDAVEGGNWLRKHGFENILDYPEMSHLTPETAPPGAIIVYEKINSNRNTTVDGVRRGAPGHIEIKASENEYISDFINDEPTRVGGLRRPIAIYYQIPDSYKEQLQEVPQ